MKKKCFKMSIIQKNMFLNEDYTEKYVFNKGLYRKIDFKISIIQKNIF